MSNAAAQHPFRLADYRVWPLVIVTVLGTGLFYYQGLIFLADEWSSDQYSHGSLIPVVSAAIVWLKRSEIASLDVRGSWWGCLLLAGAMLVGLVGRVATIQLLVHVALVLSVLGIVVSFAGGKVARTLWFPLIYLFFMIPLPDFLQVRLSGELQLLSSSLGVFFIRLFDISVFLEGNVIDLGDYKMQVVEACNGLRYLFPLLSFGVLVAYLYDGPLWQRLFVIFSTIPIAVLMNSVRIGLIGVLYEHHGLDAAQGFLHDFEGWAVFLVCLAVLLVELKLLSYLNSKRLPFFDRFTVTKRPPEAEGRQQLQ